MSICPCEYRERVNQREKDLELILDKSPYRYDSDNKVLISLDMGLIEAIRHRIRK
jgi:hypothetical protein